MFARRDIADVANPVLHRAQCTTGWFCCAIPFYFILGNRQYATIRNDAIILFLFIVMIPHRSLLWFPFVLSEDASYSINADKHSFFSLLNTWNVRNSDPLFCARKSCSENTENIEEEKKNNETLMDSKKQDIWIARKIWIAACFILQ